MRTSFGMYIRSELRTPLLIAVASSITLLTSVGICSDNDPAANSSSRHPTYRHPTRQVATRQVTWGKIDSSSSNTVTRSDRPNVAQMDWQKEDSSTSRRTGPLPATQSVQSGNIPWQQVQSSSPSKSPTKALVEAADNISSRQLSGVSSRQLSGGLSAQTGLSGSSANLSGQVPWDKASPITEAPIIEGSSRISRQNSSDVLNEAHKQPSTSGLAIRNTGVCETIPDCSIDHSASAGNGVSVPWEAITEKAVALPTNSVDLQVNPSQLPSAEQEFALMEWPTLPTDSLPSESEYVPALINELLPTESVAKVTEQLDLPSEAGVGTDDDASTETVVTDLLTDDARLSPDNYQIETLQSEHKMIEEIESTPALLASHFGNQATNHPIKFGQIAAVQSQSTNNAPIGVLPIARLTQSDTSRNVANSFNTDKYTGPMASAEELFYNLNLSSEFQNQTGESLQAQRTSSNSEASHFNWLPGFYTWASPSFYHRPLYFEQPNLERYGMGPRHCIQPLYSGMHFFGSIALMPYKLMTQHPNERVYSLGNQRPGDPACYQRRSLLGQSQFGEVCRYWDEHSGYQ